MTALAQTPMAPPPRPEQPFPRGAGILLGLGLGGFFDGIVFHQILQWHHLLTCAGFPADSLRNLEINTLADGLFHASTYVFVVLGLVALARAGRRACLRWSALLVVGSVLIVAAALFLFYWFGNVSGGLRTVGLIVAMGLAIALFATTTQGHAAREYVSESNFELRKVVWPTRQETIQTTIVISLVVLALSLILWVIDLTLGYVILEKLLKP